MFKKDSRKDCKGAFMKKRMLIVGLIALLMAIGMLIVGCEYKCGGKCGNSESNCGAWCGFSNTTCNC